jgi:hypothetical protein
VCPGQARVLSLTVPKSAQLDTMAKEREQRELVQFRVTDSIGVIRSVIGLSEVRKKQLRLDAGQFELDKAPQKYGHDLDGAAGVGTLPDVIMTAQLILANDDVNFPDCAPNISLGGTNNTHKQSLVFFMGWISVLSLRCNQSCCSIDVVRSLFDESLYLGVDALEQKYVDFWYLACFVVSVQRFILVHVIREDDGDVCRLRFCEPAKIAAEGGTLIDLLFGSVSLIASATYRAFTPLNMETGRGVLGKFTDDMLKKLACDYCVGAGVAHGATWDGAREHFRTFVGTPVPAPKKKRVDKELQANTQRAMAILLGDSSCVQEA